jgi:hypothetical protein
MSLCDHLLTPEFVRAVLIQRGLGQGVLETDKWWIFVVAPQTFLGVRLSHVLLSKQDSRLYVRRAGMLNTNPWVELDAASARNEAFAMMYQDWKQPKVEPFRDLKEVVVPASQGKRYAMTAVIRNADLLIALSGMQDLSAELGALPKSDILELLKDTSPLVVRMCRPEFTLARKNDGKDYIQMLFHPLATGHPVALAL